MGGVEKKGCYANSEEYIMAQSKVMTGRREVEGIERETALR